MNKTISINTVLFFLSIVFFSACSGTRKYYKAGEKLETEGLTDEAAEFYLEAVQRKTTNVGARIKLKQVGQKYVSELGSDFYRNYNLDQTEASLQSFEKLKSFISRSGEQGVNLIYPSEYEDNYKAIIEKYCFKNYTLGTDLLKSKNYSDALKYFANVVKYKPDYKKLAQLKIIAICEPLYQNAIAAIENKNYIQATRFLSAIQQNNPNPYKDSKDLWGLCVIQQKKGILLFKSGSSTEKKIADYLFDNFSSIVVKDLATVSLISNGPFVSLPQGNSGINTDLIQSIRKATGADYFYTFDITDKQLQYTEPTKNIAKCYRRVTYRTNDGRLMMDYKPTDYYHVTGKKRFAYQFKYSLINAVSNQMVCSENITMNMQDNLEYNEFVFAPQLSMDNYFPYNPLSSFGAQYNIHSWRNLFYANRTIMSEQQLAEMANQAAIKKFKGTIVNYIK